MLRRLLEAYRRAQRRPEPLQVVVEPDGFAILTPTGTAQRVRWASVTRVEAYKRDNFTTDEVCLACTVAERPGMLQEISEEWPGFQDLFAPMEQALDVSPTWYPEIIHPAFAPNARVLYERPAESAPALVVDAR